MYFALSSVNACSENTKPQISESVERYSHIDEENAKYMDVSCFIIRQEGQSNHPLWPTPATCLGQLLSRMCCNAHVRQHKNRCANTGSCVDTAGPEQMDSKVPLCYPSLTSTEAFLGGGGVAGGGGTGRGMFQHRLGLYS